MSRPGRAWPIILTGLVVWTLSVGMYRTFGVFFKPMAEELGWSRTLTSGGFAVMGLVMGLMGPLAGALADRRGPRLVVAGSGLFMGLGYALLSRLHSVGQFYGFFFLVGLGMGSAFAPVSAAVSRWFAQGMGLALGLVSIGGGLGMMTVVPLAERLIAWWGWRPAYLVMGVLMGVGVMVAGFLMPQRKERVVIAGGEDPPAAAAMTLRQALGTSSFWKVFMASALGIGAAQGIVVHLVPYITDKGWSPAAAALSITFMGGGDALGRLFWGGLSDRIGRKKSFVASLAIGGLAILWLMVAQGLWQIYVFAFVFGMVHGGFFPVFTALLGELYGLASLGAIMGVNQTGNTVGGALGALVTGYLFDRTGSYQGALVLLALTLFAASALVLTLKEK